MRKNKFMATVMAATLAFTMMFSLANGVDAKAAEIADDTLVVSEDINVGNEVADIQYQEPVEISELKATGDNELTKLSERIAVDESSAEDIVATQADTTVIAGTVSDYLTTTGDAKIYIIDLPAGVYLQMQLTTPTNAGLDYDLYLLDEEGYILKGSESYTCINGTSGTLPEALGYFTDKTATYYMYVLSSVGGSVSESFKLDYSISTAYDACEPDENPGEAVEFTYGVEGGYIEWRDLSSPIDNDWYKITVPDNRIYDKLKITATTSSTNTCSVEVYQNISSNGYQMKRVGSGGTIPVSTGTYYIRVSNAKTMEDFDDLNIQNYELTVTPVLKVTGIIITDLEGTEGLNKVVTYPGYGTRFRTKGEGKLTIYGTLVAIDNSTGKEYYAMEGQAGQQIDGLYHSLAWEANNTASNARRTGTGITDSNGQFAITLSLPPGIGVNSYYAPASTHYFDECEVSVTLHNKASISNLKEIFHLAYTMYHPIS